MSEREPTVVPAAAVLASRRAARARHVDDRSIRRQQVGLAVMLFCLALLAPLGQMFGLWPIVSVGGVVSGLLLWGALRDESIAGPVVGLVLTNLSGMFVGDGPAFGPLAGVVLAVALGEHLSMMQHSRYATPGHAVRWSGSGPVAVHAIIAAAAMACTIAAGRLPAGRAWSLCVIAALVLVGVVAQRRRASLPPPG